MGTWRDLTWSQFLQTRYSGLGSGAAAGGASCGFDGAFAALSFLALEGFLDGAFDTFLVGLVEGALEALEVFFLEVFLEGAFARFFDGFLEGFFAAAMPRRNEPPGSRQHG